MTDFIERVISRIRSELAECGERVIKMDNNKNAMLIQEIYGKRILVNPQELGRQR